MRLNERNSQRSAEQAMQAQTTKGNNYDGGKNKKGKGKWKNNKWKGSGKGSNNSRNHNQNEETDKKSGGNHKVGNKKFNKKGIQCHNCQKWGHFVDECINKRVPRNADEAQLAQDEDFDFDKVLLLATTNSEEDSVICGILTQITVSVTAEGIGKVIVQRKDGQHSFINDLLYVPNMKNNLLSLGQLLEKGYSLQMEDSQLKMLDSNKRLILKAPLSDCRISMLGCFYK
ncbi:uncharacterized protein LOC114404254 [Glycine soja]|uniref:uncharacterized protein LOC114404254 n=1 Tax=Glycine soja TaxID=3848 RepID=UPI00103D3089|nr:uncharacterized protein LOC114404254 [Glycine soja]